MKNIIYALYCPVTKKPVYVGKSTQGMKRPFEHINEKSHSKKVNEWVAYLKDEGLSPVVIILETTNHTEFLNHKELFWINKLLNEGNLLLNQNGVNPTFFSSNIFSQECENNFLLELALFVKGRRKLLKLTQQEFANKCGIGLRFLRGIEQGTKNNYNTKSIEKILYCFGTKLTIERLHQGDT